MSALSLLQDSCISKQYTSFKNLPLGAYKIVKFASAETLYGRKIRAEFGSQFVYLPKSVGDCLDDKKIEELNEIPVMMVYNGKSHTNNR